MAFSRFGAKLTDQEENDFVDFLGALTNEVPNITYPALPTRTELPPESSLAK
jgi:cytochrome c peroxidase